MVIERQGGKEVAAGGKRACKLSGTLPRAAEKRDLLTGLISTLQAMEIYVVTAVYPGGCPGNPSVSGAPEHTAPWHQAPGTRHQAPTTQNPPRIHDR
jgi:hypothetical protein